MCRVGRELGSTTGRKRRIGWLNIDQLIQSCQVNAYNTLALMKVDVLFGLEEISVFLDGKLKKLKGFSSIDDQSFKNLVSLIEHETGVQIRIISYGPDRNETIVI
jgi:adenylosuccinate synthase